MYIKSIALKNYRRFGEEENTVQFSKSEQKDKKVSKATTLLIGKNNTGKSTIVDLLKKLSLGTGSNIFNINDINQDFLYKTFETNVLSETKIEDFILPNFELEIKFIIDDIKNNSLTNFSDLIVIEDIQQANLEELEVTAIAKFECQNEQKADESINNLQELLKKPLNTTDQEYINDLSKMNVSKKMIETFTNGFDTFLEVLTCENISSNEGTANDNIDERKSMQHYLKNNFFNQYIENLEKVGFSLNFYPKDSETKTEVFSMSDLLEVKIITANNIKNDESLTRAFNKIVQSFFKNDPANLPTVITDVNYDITDIVEKNYTESINSVVQEIESTSHINMNLQASLTVDKLLNNFIDYYYQEKNYYFPQSQYGLGYTNLMVIIAEMVEYLQTYDMNKAISKVNVVSIEEPETFMHPQMQELFITNIENAIDKLIENQESYIENQDGISDSNSESKNESFKSNFQLIITTHSSHIVNSKIHTSNSFNDINYLSSSSEEDATKVTPIQDTAILADSGEAEAEKMKMLNFLKKHMRLDNSDLFFADAVIFVEGGTEEHYIKYKLSENEALNKFYISVINVNGAHAKAYLSLCELMNIPTVIFTDIDYARDQKSKGSKESESVEESKNIEDSDNTEKAERKKKSVETEFSQLTTLNAEFGENETVTTNATIKYIHSPDGKNNVTLATLNEKSRNNKEGNPDFYEFRRNNIVLFSQGFCNGSYATSFEEALILENYDTKLLHDALKISRPGLYADIFISTKDDDVDDVNEDLKNFSYFFQKKLGDKKRTFINEILYQEIVSDEKLNLPKYIKAGFDYLDEKLNSGEGENVK